MIPVCIIALILLIWFRTDAWLEYCRLFKLDRISYYTDYDKKHKEDLTLTYLLYLRMYHNRFFIRLITCPICLSVWLGIILSIFINIYLFPIYTIGGLIIYLIINKLLD